MNLIELVAPVLLGGKLTGLVDAPEPKGFAVKAPQFSFMQMEGAEPTVGVEMRSTGEVACFGDTLPEAMSRALIASGLRIPQKGETGIILADEKSDMKRMRSLVEGFAGAGIVFVTTQSLANGLGSGMARASTTDEMAEMLASGKASFVISLSTNLNKMRRDLFKVRRKAVELQIPFLTTLEEGEVILMCVLSPLKSLI
jgi:carbamoyl-phosphate synthase large subunit